MNTTIIMELERKMREENSKITIGDTSETTVLKLLEGEDKPLENVLISLFNLAKVNQYKIERLENNLELLASRVHNTIEDFTEEEIEQIQFALENLDIEMLADVNFDKDRLHDSLYCDVVPETEEDYDKLFKIQKDLVNKIKYPSQKMHKTFNGLVAEAIKSIKGVN
jgi:hypothetical protein